VPALQCREGTSRGGWSAYGSDLAGPLPDSTIGLRRKRA
jgi:hypothetical protein